jgi:hypothetical protein
MKTKLFLMGNSMVQNYTIDLLLNVVKIEKFDFTLSSDSWHLERVNHSSNNIQCHMFSINSLFLR